MRSSYSSLTTSTTQPSQRWAQLIVLVAQAVTLIAAAIYSSLASTSWEFYAWLYNGINRRRYKDKDGNSIPDGPVGLPIIGNYLPLRKSFPELQVDKWAKEHGPLYSMWIGDQLFIVVSDPRIVKDLFVSNGAIFSSRKESFIKSQIVFARRGITTMSYTDKWRRHRRIAANVGTARSVAAHADTIEFEALELVRNLYTFTKGGKVPMNPQAHMGRAALNNMLTLVFGIRTDTINHPMVARSLALSREFMNCSSAVAMLTDFLPILQHVPGNPMTARAKRLHQALLDVYGGMMDEIVDKINRGDEVPDCLVKDLVEKKEKENMDWLDMVMICCAFMIGGVESTSSIPQWFSTLIPTHPEIQARAHEELDRVVGRDRLPTLEDEKDLPYIHAIIKELERTRNPFWLGTPHQSTEDFTYRGQFIPKNSVLLMNTWTMHNNPERYPEPEKFNPDRYIDDRLSAADSVNVANPMERDHWTFGAGRRVCPGIRYAEAEIFLAISRMLWAFRLEEVPGEPISLRDYVGAAGRSPVPFRINLIPRHDRVAEILGVSL
ncbi:hypothetical protein AX16_003947 [Volvariella volvacea WC 439]|nr:hypothetical protein AX16_003947 [Volvariella volvacea WC 439]